MILKEHQDFARELVALARKHKMSDINMTFRDYLNRDVMVPEGYVRPYDRDVRLQWSQGRHGDSSKIRLETSAAVELPESKGDKT